MTNQMMFDYIKDGVVIVVGCAGQNVDKINFTLVSLWGWIVIYYIVIYIIYL